MRNGRIEEGFEVFPTLEPGVSKKYCTVSTSAKAGGAAQPAGSRKQRNYELLEDGFIVQLVGFENLGNCRPTARTFQSDVDRRIDLFFVCRFWVQVAHVARIYCAITS